MPRSLPTSDAPARSRSFLSLFGLAEGGTAWALESRRAQIRQAGAALPFALGAQALAAAIVAGLGLSIAPDRLPALLGFSAFGLTLGLAAWLFLTLKRGPQASAEDPDVRGHRFRRRAGLCPGAASDRSAQALDGVGGRDLHGGRCGGSRGRAHLPRAVEGGRAGVRRRRHRHHGLAVGRRSGDGRDPVRRLPDAPCSIGWRSPT